MFSFELVAPMHVSARVALGSNVLRDSRELSRSVGCASSPPGKVWPMFTILFAPPVRSLTLGGFVYISSLAWSGAPKDDFRTAGGGKACMIVDSNGEASAINLPPFSSVDCVPLSAACSLNACADIDRCHRTIAR